MYRFGIDFGTSNSLIAYMEEDRKEPEPILDPSTGEPYPSIAVYRDGKFIVGGKAKEIYIPESQKNPERVFKSIKKRLGENYIVDLGDKQVTPVDVVAEIIKFLKEEAKKRINTDIKLSVFSVPIYFDGKERKALRGAAEKAGIEVERFIHEPTAAVLRHGLKASYYPQYIIVFDWGGGSLDISLVKIEDDTIEELGVESFQKAGDDFDKAILDYAINWFSEKYKLEIDGLPPGILNRSLLICEEVKKRLSNSLREPFEIPDFYDGKNLLLTLERVTFENLIGRYVEEALKKLDKVIDQSGISYIQINKVLMSGGTCKIPYIFQKLQDRFGRRVEVINPSSCIAEGNALASFYQEELSPHLASAIGVKLSDDTFFPIFEKGYPLGERIKQRQQFYVTDVSTGEAVLVLCESPSKDINPTDINLIGVLKIPIEEKLEEGAERIVVDFEIDEDYVLNIRGHGEFKQKCKEREITRIKFGVKWERKNEI